jgi:DNA polymerase-3 subunit epsilon
VTGHWRDGPLCGLDFETTGVDPEDARIVTATVCWVNPGVRALEWLCDPGVDIPEQAIAIHGVTTEQARASGRTEGEVAAEVDEQLQLAFDAETPIVLFNASYDLTVLDRALRRADVGCLVVRGNVIDPFVIDKHYDRYRKGRRTLTAMAAQYGVTLGGEGAHNATADTVGACRLAWRLPEVHPELRSVSVHDLHSRQINWYREQATGLERYFRAKGNDVDADAVNKEWPMRAHLDDRAPVS